MSKVAKAGKSSVHWEPLYEDMLFDLWEDNVQALKSSHRKTEIYSQMAIKLAEAGFEVHLHKIKSKLDNLIRKHKMDLKEYKATGKVSTWRNFKRAHAILKPGSTQNFSQRPPEHTDKTMHKTEADDDNYSTVSSVDSFLIATSEESISIRPTTRQPKIDEPPSKKRKTVKTPEMTPFELAMIETVKERTEDLRKAATERLSVLNRMVDNNIAFQEKILEMMSKNDSS